MWWSLHSFGRSEQEITTTVENSFIQGLEVPESKATVILSGILVGGGGGECRVGRPYGFDEVRIVLQEQWEVVGGFKKDAVRSDQYLWKAFWLQRRPECKVGIPVVSLWLTVIEAGWSGGSGGGKKAGGEIRRIGWLVGCEGLVGYYVESEFGISSLATGFIPHQTNCWAFSSGF